MSGGGTGLGRLWRPAAVTMVATLGSWASSWGIAEAAGLHADVIVLGTVLPVTLARVTARGHARSPLERVLRLVMLPVVALAASEAGLLLAHHAVWGGAVFVAVMAGAIWVRRFGRSWSTAGSLVSLPFVVLLVAPVAPAPGHEHTLWPALIAVVALVWVNLVQWVAWATGFVPRPEERPEAPVRRPSTSRRLPASTRMAVQMALALGLAYGLGRWWFPQHWSWMLLSAYVVLSGNRGRGDVVHKGLLRLAGALGGTLGATLLADAFPTGDRTALVWLFVVLAAAVLLRPVSYAFWAAGVTAMLALLHGYYGEHGAGLLGERLAGVALGAAIGVLAAWFVLPVRTRDVFRRRLADARDALAELRTARAERPQDLPQARERFARAVALLEEIEPALRLAGRAGRPHRVGESTALELLARMRAARDHATG